jgi:hypothetical protein
MLVLARKVVVVVIVDITSLVVAVLVVSAKFVVVAEAKVVADWPSQLQPTASEPHQSDSALQWLSVVPQLPHFDRQCAAVCQALPHSCPVQLPPSRVVDIVVLEAKVVVMNMVEVVAVAVVVLVAVAVPVAMVVVEVVVVAAAVVVPVATADMTALQSTY